MRLHKLIDGVAGRKAPEQADAEWLHYRVGVEKVHQPLVVAAGRVDVVVTKNSAAS